MSEQQQFEGEYWTKQSVAILKHLGWKQRGKSGMDIKCSNTREHATGKGEKRKNPHGIDSLFQYEDPHFKQEVSVIVESKRRKWQGISKSTIQEFVEQVLMTMECAEGAVELDEFCIDNISLGILFIWCHETELYDYNKFQSYLAELEVPKRKNPHQIVILSNNEILRLVSLINTVEEIKKDSNTTKFEYFYPSDNFGGFGTSISTRKEVLNISYIMSKIILAKGKELLDIQGNKIFIDCNYIFFFAEPTLSELNFMYQLVQRNQLEDASKIYIYFYGQQIAYKSKIDDFVRNKKEYYSENNKNISIIVKYMKEYADVPADYAEGE